MAEHKPKIVFLTSPNNPDGSTISEEDLLQILALPVLVVLDEAYIEFCTDVPSRIKWVQQYDNLVVLRTFSKCAALAGMRVGYGAFPLGMIEYLWRAKQPYNVSVAAEVGHSWRQGWHCWFLTAIGIATCYAYGGAGWQIHCILHCSTCLHTAWSDGML